MAQITIYLDGETEALVRRAVKAAGVSKSRWVADAVRDRVRNEWPQSVRNLAGAWSDFPTTDEIRNQQATQSPRERL